MNDVFDKLEDLGIRRPAKRKQFVAEFVRMPMVWVKKLEAAKHVATYQLAVFLQYRQYRNWKQPDEPIMVSNVAVNEWGISRRQKCEALRELENLGLVEVERCGNHSPAVTLKI